MSFWLVAFARAAEPVVLGPSSGRPIEVGVSHEVIVSWDEARLVAARAESPALGPDLLTLGPWGEVAYYDPVGRQVVIVGRQAFPVDRADDLLFTPAGTLLVLDGSTRRLGAFHIAGSALGWRTLPDIVPTGGTLRLAGQVVCSEDVFGGCHPIATLTDEGSLSAYQGARLLPPQRAVRRVGDVVLVDGRPVVRVAGRGGARVVGDWLLVEEVDDGVVTRRAISLADGSEVEVSSEDRLYTPTRDVASGWDGTFGWMVPQADGLHIRMVTP